MLIYEIVCIFAQKCLILILVIIQLVTFFIIKQFINLLVTLVY